jgi:hypothetical protein
VYCCPATRDTLVIEVTYGAVCDGEKTPAKKLPIGVVGGFPALKRPVRIQVVLVTTGVDAVKE